MYVQHTHPHTYARPPCAHTLQLVTNEKINNNNNTALDISSWCGEEFCSDSIIPLFLPFSLCPSLWRQIHMAHFMLRWRQHVERCGSVRFHRPKIEAFILLKFDGFSTMYAESSTIRLGQWAFVEQIFAWQAGKHKIIMNKMRFSPCAPLAGRDCESAPTLTHTSHTHTSTVYLFAKLMANLSTGAKHT